MSLLPTTHVQFQLKDYWEKFFQKRKAPFEWYGEYLDLCHVLHKYIKTQNTVLMVGCGNSKLSEDLYDVGFHNIDNIDISEVVIKQMSTKNSSKRPNMTYKVVDMLDMPYNDSSYDCVIDKGTLDAICVDNEKETNKKVDKMFSQIRRVLKPNGRYVCVTLCQEHVMNKLLTAHCSSDLGWIVRGHVIKSIGEVVGVASSLPVFVFVMTKMASIPGRPAIKVYEYVTEGDKCVRVDDISGLEEFVKNHQQYALVQYHLNSIHLDEQICVNLWSTENTSEPRFTLRVVDIPKVKATNGPFAIFLVPQGRETNWMFSSEEGCSQLAESAGYERLIIVTLHRGHTYQELDQIKDEVSNKALELAQNNLPEGKKWPVLSLSEGVGTRTIITEGTSTVSGQYVIEESKDEDDRGILRRLIFVDSPHLAQTEVLMIQPPKSRSKKKGRSGGAGITKQLEFSFNEMVSTHHKIMFGSLGLIMNDKPADVINVLIVGLGGGGLSMFLKKEIEIISQHVIELDPTLVSVAMDWFGLQPTTISDHHQLKEEKQSLIGERGGLHIIKGDGVQFVTSLAERCKGVSKYHAIILDVDNKDVSSGLNSPPLSFTTPSFLQAAKSILHPNGIFVTNLSARNKELEQSIFHDICRVFPTIIRIPIPEYIHDVLVGQQSITKSCESHEDQPSSLIGRPFLISKGFKSNLATFLSHCDKRDELIKELCDCFKTALVYYL